MAAAEPVKNPQGLVSPMDESRNVGPSQNPRSKHQKRQAIEKQSLPVKPRGPLFRSQDTGVTGMSSPVEKAPLEIGKVGETDRRTAQRLKRGKLDVDARLDLHGCTVIQAHDRLLEFLRVSQSTGARCVLVVTGKGLRKARGQATASEYADDTRHGKLRLSVPRWLNEPLFRPLVLSVSYAVQKDGGEGALYVLLRKKQNGAVRSGVSSKL